MSQEIELETIDTDLSMSSSLTEFERETSEYKLLSKRRHHKVLSYITANYLWIIKLLCLTLIAFVIAFTILLIYHFIIITSNNASVKLLKSEENVTQNIKVEENNTQESATHSYQLANGTGRPSVIAASTTSAYVQDNAETTVFSVNPVVTIPCRNIHCKKIGNPCAITNYNYKSIKQYSCCSCFTIYRLIRYEADLLNSMYSVILSGSGLNVCEVTEFDVREMPELQCIHGSWTVVRESEATCYFKYSMLSSSCDPEKE